MFPLFSGSWLLLLVLPTMAGTEQYSEEFLHQSKQGLINTVSSVFIALEVFCVSLRFLAKWVGRLKLGWDDAFMILGLILCIADAACTMGECGLLRCAYVND